MAITPASIRNNNPGAMYPGPSAKKFGSTGREVLHSRDGEHLIATFASPVHGAAAQFDLLARSYTGLTLRAAIRKWCGDFYLSSYLKVLEQQCGVTPDDILSPSFLRDPDKAIALAKAMALQEAGREFPMADEQWREAHALAFPGEVDGWTPENATPTLKQPEEEPSLPPPIPVAEAPAETATDTDWTIAKLVAFGSRSMAGLRRLKAALGLGAGGLGSFSLLDKSGTGGGFTHALKSFVSDWGLVLLAVVVAAALLAVLVAQHHLLVAAREGRYRPRGAQG